MPHLNLVEIFLVSILPISLIKFKIIHPKFRLWVLGGVCILLFALISLEDTQSVELGVGMDNVVPGMTAYAGATLIAVLFLMILAKITRNQVARDWYGDPHFLFLFIPISFAQQCLFQGFILFKLQAVFPLEWAVIAAGIIFGYMHTIYPRPLLSMTLGSMAGMLFAFLYVVYPNIFIASITHAVLNFTAVYLGFFTFVNPDGTPKKTSLNLINTKSIRNPKLEQQAEQVN